MLCCPARLPESFSKRLPGGTRRSESSAAASSIHNLRIALRWIVDGSLLDRLPSNTFLASASRKLAIIRMITSGVINVKRSYLHLFRFGDAEEPKTVFE